MFYNRSQAEVVPIMQNAYTSAFKQSIKHNSGGIGVTLTFQFQDTHPYPSLVPSQKNRRKNPSGNIVHYSWY